MDDTLRQLVRDRSGGVCEYCQFPEEHSFNPFQVDHIIAEKHGGPSIESNLAWSCFHCNTYKGPNVAGWVAETNEIVRLYHPRTDRWSDHFEWNGTRLIGRTAIGTATLSVLRSNHPDALVVRQMLFDLWVPLSPAASCRSWRGVLFELASRTTVCPKTAQAPYGALNV